LRAGHGRAGACFGAAAPAARAGCAIATSRGGSLAGRRGPRTRAGTLKDMAHPALSAFTPQVRDWFGRAFAEPTAAQAQAWPAIATGQHTLISAPTGSGKTLAAFLWALDRLVAEP
jgi:superfamily II DNA helicase RecQ